MNGETLGSSRFPWWMGAVLAGMAVFACAPEDGPEGRDPEQPQFEGECPNHEEIAPPGVEPREGDTLVVVSLAQEIARIFEYHDCQSLRTGAGYGPIVGIWARTGLQDLTESDFEAPGGVAVAEIHNFSSQRYGRLGIEPGRNCLYLSKDPDGEEWVGVVLQVAEAEPCAPAVDQGSLESPPTLGVRRTVPSDDRADYSPAARWDWDDRSNLQIMGVMCAVGWCEVGVPGFSSMATHTGFPVREIKGWYDEQDLLIPASAGGPRVGERAAIFPVRDLGDHSADDFLCQPEGGTTECPRAGDGSGWIHVGTILYRGSNPGPYKPKLNLDPGENEVYIRRDPGDADGSEWQARIISESGDTAYKEVIRVPHEAAPVPAAARWSWQTEDEWGWYRCGGGCCRVTGNDE